MVYLAEKFGWNDVYPRDDLEKKARINEYLHWHHSNIRDITRSVFAPTARPDLKIPEVMVKVGRKNATRALRFLEKRLSSSLFLVGDSPTLADIAAFGEVGQCLPEFVDLVDFGNYPRLLAWCERMKKLPSEAVFAKVHKTLLKYGPKIKEMMPGGMARL